MMIETMITMMKMMETMKGTDRAIQLGQLQFGNKNKDADDGYLDDDVVDDDDDVDGNSDDN